MNGLSIRALSGYLAMMLLAACAPVVSASPTPTIAPTAPHAPTPTTAIPPTNTVTTPVEIEPALITDQPMIFAGWSPDSRYVAYWLIDKGQAPDVIRIAGKLSFTGVDGQTCTDDHLTIHSTWDEFGKLVLARGQQVIVRTDKGVYQGTPCGEFEPVEGDLFPDRDTQISPDGRTRAHISLSAYDQIETYTVTFTDTASGRVLETTSWQGSIFNERTGPRWLNSDIFVLGQTFDRGLLYYDVTANHLGDVGADFFRDRSACNPDACWIHTFADPQTGVFHILLLPTSHQQTRLYHSETGTVEDVQIKMAWSPYARNPDLTGFTEDGKWLLGLGGPYAPFTDPDEGYWIRPVDPPGSALTLFNRDEPHTWGDLSLGTGRAALWDSSMYIYTFPAGELLAQATIHGGTPQEEIWSPDGKWLAVLGNTENGEQVLALWQPSP